MSSDGPRRDAAKAPVKGFPAVTLIHLQFAFHITEGIVITIEPRTGLRPERIKVLVYYCISPAGRAACSEPGSGRSG